jgi:hypothetical protein
MVEIRPKALTKFITGDNFPCRFQQDRQEQKRLFLQPYFVALFSQLTGAQVLLQNWQIVRVVGG